MTLRLGLMAPFLETAAERIVTVVVCGRELEQLPELVLGLFVAVDAEVGDPERFADRGLLGLEPLRLLERDRRLRRHALPQVGPALLEEVVRVAHSLLLRYGKFSCTKSSASVKSRVRPTSNAETRRSSSIAR